MNARGLGRWRRVSGRTETSRLDSGSGGFTLIETALATTVLMVALMTASMATLRMHSLRRQNRERVVAQNALRSMAEQIHAISGSEQGNENLQVWANAVTSAVAAGGSIGPTFDVRELNAVPDGQGELAPLGTITVFTDETVTDNAIGFDMGLPRDLNGDGVANDTNVADGLGSAGRILPVLLTVRWRGVSGVQQMEHAFYVLGY